MSDPLEYASARADVPDALAHTSESLRDVRDTVSATLAPAAFSMLSSIANMVKSDRSEGQSSDVSVRQ